MLNTLMTLMAALLCSALPAQVDTLPSAVGLSAVPTVANPTGYDWRTGPGCGGCNPVAVITEGLDELATITPGEWYIFDRLPWAPMNLTFTMLDGGMAPGDCVQNPPIVGDCEWQSPCTVQVDANLPLLSGFELRHGFTVGGSYTTGLQPAFCEGAVHSDTFEIWAKADPSTETPAQYVTTLTVWYGCTPCEVVPVEPGN